MACESVLVYPRVAAARELFGPFPLFLNSFHNGARSTRLVGSRFCWIGSNWDDFDTLIYLFLFLILDSGFTLSFAIPIG